MRRIRAITSRALNGITSRITSEPARAPQETSSAHRTLRTTQTHHSQHKHHSTHKHLSTHNFHNHNHHNIHHHPQLLSLRRPNPYQTTPTTSLKQGVACQFHSSRPYPPPRRLPSLRCPRRGQAPPSIRRLALHPNRSHTPTRSRGIPLRLGLGRFPSRYSSSQEVPTHCSRWKLNLLSLSCLTEERSSNQFRFRWREEGFILGLLSRSPTINNSCNKLSITRVSRIMTQQTTYVVLSFRVTVWWLVYAVGLCIWLWLWLLR
mmetsp:Transcript_12760/g.23175  ORF Transcript_12760/g.23175 Transcript_12760/m.23175 type:complete len:262 (-) Transcript_12760:246-1031(-)